MSGEFFAFEDFDGVERNQADQRAQAEFWNSPLG